MRWLPVSARTRAAASSPRSSLRHTCTAQQGAKVSRSRGSPPWCLPACLDGLMNMAARPPPTPLASPPCPPTHVRKPRTHQTQWACRLQGRLYLLCHTIHPALTTYHVQHAQCRAPTRCSTQPPTMYSTAPLRASSRLVSYPSPWLAPVTMQCWSARRAGRAGRIAASRGRWQRMRVCAEQRVAPPDLGEPVSAC